MNEFIVHSNNLTGPSEAASAQPAPRLYFTFNCNDLKVSRS